LLLRRWREERVHEVVEKVEYSSLVVGALLLLLLLLLGLLEEAVLLVLRVLLIVVSDLEAEWSQAKEHRLLFTIKS
jgi:hypothetical protein